MSSIFAQHILLDMMGSLHLLISVKVLYNQQWIFPVFVFITLTLITWNSFCHAIWLNFWFSSQSLVTMNSMFGIYGLSPPSLVVLLYQWYTRWVEKCCRIMFWFNINTLPELQRVFVKHLGLWKFYFNFSIKNFWSLRPPHFNQKPSFHLKNVYQLSSFWIQAIFYATSRLCSKENWRAPSALNLWKLGCSA